MKLTNKTVLVSVIVTAGSILFLHFALSGAAKAGILDSIINSDLEEITPSANYELSTYGFDSRVYEWTPAHNKNISCVFVASNKSSGVACYPKAEQ